MEEIVEILDEQVEAGKKGDFLQADRLCIRFHAVQQKIDDVQQELDRAIVDVVSFPSAEECCVPSVDNV